MATFKRFCFLPVICVLLLACNWVKHNDIARIIHHQSQILSDFRRRSIFKDRNHQVVIVEEYNRHGRVNFFSFTNRRNLLYDSLQYVPADSGLSKTNVLAKTKGLADEMDAFNIDQISAEFNALGVDLKFYLKKGGALLYVSDSNRINNPEWKSYIEKSSRVESHWYYSEN